MSVTGRSGAASAGRPSPGLRSRRPRSLRPRRWPRRRPPLATADPRPRPQQRTRAAAGQKLDAFRSRGSAGRVRLFLWEIGLRRGPRSKSTNSTSQYLKALTRDVAKRLSCRCNGSTADPHTGRQGIGPFCKRCLCFNATPCRPMRLLEHLRVVSSERYRVRQE